MKVKNLYVVLAVGLSMLCSVQAVGAVASDMTGRQDTLSAAKKKKTTFFQAVAKPVKWIIRNWSAYDPAYATPSFYMWAAQMQHTVSCEWIDLGYDGVTMNMRSKVSQKFGPYLSYSFIGNSFAVDFNAATGKNRRNEFTLSINSNLMNVDLIRRRTGGDFMVTNLDIMGLDRGTYDFSELAEHHKVGDDVRYDITGININVFTNHKKYSNPAAFSNGAIQLRSVGSPIVGLGYTHQKLANSITNNFMDFAAQKCGYEKFDGSLELLNKMLYGESLTGNNYAVMAVGQAVVPSVVKVDDYHMQLGYAQNFAFSRRFLLGMSLVASPGVKVITADNHSSHQYTFRNEIAHEVDKPLPLVKEMIQSGELKVEGQANRDYIMNLDHVSPDVYEINHRSTSLGCNFAARASLTYNYNRWRFGVNANFNGYVYNRDDFNFYNSYGSLTAYAGYCFGRKKQYRIGGKNREAYVNAALTKSQIAEMRDTNPESNIAKASATGKRTRYHHDRIDFNISGCDFVMGPDGTYGTYR